MNRRTFTLALIAGVSSLAWGQNFSPAQIHDKYSSAIVLIKTDTGLGTGFIVSSDGLIATAFHVIAAAKRVGVKTSNGDIFDQVLLVAKDELKDIAILKIAGFDLPVVEQGNSNDVKIGEHVTVIGNPLGEEQLRESVTDGIVSGVRDFGEGHKVIQMSAPISPGNSGCPIFSDRGKVIGIADFKLVAGENLNFAVPSNYLAGLLGIADKDHPLQTWSASGADNVFSNSKKHAGRFTGTWKSTCVGVYQIQDTGIAVRTIQLTAALYWTYDLKWEGDVVFGLVSGGKSKDWLLLKLADPEHIQIWKIRGGKEDDQNKQLAWLRAKSEQEKPICVWVRVSD